MYGQETSLREQIVEQYRGDLNRLLRYLPYLDKKSGKDVQDFYDGDGTYKVMPVPVYDSTLLAFVKEAKKTQFMTKYYPYTYNKYHMVNAQDEIARIKSCQIRDIDIIRAIISRYVLQGQTKAIMWTAGVEDRIFFTALDHLRRLFADYDAEMAKKAVN